jgi:protein-S-isoprenylcysteine O-methyltransferase Ste14
VNRNTLLGKALLEVLAEFAVFAALLFVSAGTLLWLAGWAFMALFFAFALAIVLWLASEDPELLAERMSSPVQRGQPLWDKVFVAAVLLLFVA